MATATEPKVWTAEDLLAFPDDGIERWIVRGQLREKPSEFPEAKVTVRNRHHSLLVISIGAVVKAWLKTQPQPRGQVYGGEAGVRLRGRTESAVGLDVVYVGPEVVASQSDETTLLDGVPILAVEILSPNDTIEQIDEWIEDFLSAGVPLVWIVDPTDETVTIYRRGVPPRMFARGDRIPEATEMPGFAPTVAELFE